jgi:hypothetical protein
MGSDQAKNRRIESIAVQHGSDLGKTTLAEIYHLRLARHLKN